MSRVFPLYSPQNLCTVVRLLNTALITIKARGPRAMNVAKRRKVQLIYRSKRIAGQFEMIHRGILLNMERSEILERVAAARESVNDLMVRLLEEEVLGNSRDVRGQTQQEIVDGVMKLLQSYLG